MSVPVRCHAGDLAFVFFHHGGDMTTELRQPIVQELTRVTQTGQETVAVPLPSIDSLLKWTENSGGSDPISERVVSRVRAAAWRAAHPDAPTHSTCPRCMGHGNEPGAKHTICHRCHGDKVVPAGEEV